MRHGLTLGKFAPLHKGHQRLIEVALGEVDQLTVLIYDAPEQTTIPLNTRANWIRRLYPGVEVIEAHDGPRQIGSSLEITSLHDAYITAAMQGRKITHFYSSEFYGAHVSLALGAIDRRIDESRTHVAISGTKIRADTFGCRHFVSPVVYRDLVLKVVFLGAPSTGKSTLAEAAAKQFDTAWVPEYGREYWEKHQVSRRLTHNQLLEIAVGHRNREDALIVDANRHLFIDTDATTTYMFSQYYHGHSSPELSKLADEALSRYDLFILCEDDIPYDATSDRSGEAQREAFQQAIRADLLRRDIPYISLTGSLNERLHRLHEVLKAKPGPWDKEHRPRAGSRNGR